VGDMAELVAQLAKSSSGLQPENVREFDWIIFVLLRFRMNFIDVLAISTTAQSRMI
jgi:hypothetical protein